MAALLAVTVAVLLIRPALQADEPRPTSPAVAKPHRERPSATRSKQHLQPSATAGHEVYVIQAGDTLGSVAGARGTTVEAIVELNPGIDPVGLRVGQRIRVK